MTNFSRRTLFQVSAGAALLPVIGVFQAAHAEVVVQNVATDAYTYFEANQQYTIWTQLVTAGGLEASARGARQYTVFAPTDAAFEKFPQVEQLLSYQTQAGPRSGNAFPDSSKIIRLVRTHVVLGKHFPKDVMAANGVVTSVAGTPITMNMGKSPATVTWKSVATGTDLSADLVENPINTFNALIYPVNSIYATALDID